MTPFAAEPGQGAVVTFKDITERKRAEQQLQYLADHDVLTGLFNRRRFGDELTQQIAVCERLDVTSALLVMDIDNFKFINDALGHHAGDELIRSLSGQLKARVRRTDIVARLGGDEFALLLTGTGPEDAIELADELLAMTRGHRVLARDKPVQVTTSIGIAMLDAAEPHGGAAPHGGRRRDVRSEGLGSRPRDPVHARCARRRTRSARASSGRIGSRARSETTSSRFTPSRSPASGTKTPTATSCSSA